MRPSPSGDAGQGTGVVGVSATEIDLDAVEICEFCGMPILEEGQDCAALDDGRCRP